MVMTEFLLAEKKIGRTPIGRITEVRNVWMAEYLEWPNLAEKYIKLLNK